MRKGTTPRYFTEEEKKAILYDYLQSGLSQRAIAFKYRLGDRSMLSNWLRQYKSRKDLLPLSSKDLISIWRQPQSHLLFMESSMRSNDGARFRRPPFTQKKKPKPLRNIWRKTLARSSQFFTNLSPERCTLTSMLWNRRSSFPVTVFLPAVWAQREWNSPSRLKGSAPTASN